MVLTRFVDSFVEDPELDVSVDFTVTPSWFEDGVEVTPDNMLERLGIDIIKELKSPTELPRALLAVLFADSNRAAKSAFQKLATTPFEIAFPDRPSDLETFAERISFEPMVPLEQSPLDFHSLAELMLQGGTIAGMAAAKVRDQPMLAFGGGFGLLLVRPWYGVYKEFVAGVGEAAKAGGQRIGRKVFEHRFQRRGIIPEDATETTRDPSMQAESTTNSVSATSDIQVTIRDPDNRPWPGAKVTIGPWELEADDEGHVVVAASKISHLSEAATEAPTAESQPAADPPPPPMRPVRGRGGKGKAKGT
jgi:hypothetical protein